MTDGARQLLDKMLVLPEGDRAELAYLLLDSVTPALSDAVECAWMKEIARREDMRSGKSIPVPAGEVFAQIDAHLAARRNEAAGA